MISFINKQIDKNNFKVWLYTPGGSFLGELLVDNPVLTLQLEGLISTFSFTIPENIEIVDNSTLNSIVNPRINEALDQFQVEVWYGDLNTDNYQKQRFIIIDTPNAFANDITRFSYKAYSREYENKFVRVINWPGVLVKEYVQKATYNVNSNLDQQITLSLNRNPRDTRLIRAELVKDFIYRLVNQTVSETAYQFALQPKESSIKIFKLNNSTWSLLTKDTDYRIVRDGYTGIISIEYITASNPNLSIGDTVYVEYKLEEPLTFALIRNESPVLNSEFDFFYTPPVSAGNGSITFFVPNIPRVFSKESVLSYDNQIPVDSEIKINIYYEATDLNLQTDEVFDNLTKDALTIQQVVNNLLQYGDEDDNSAKWTAYYSNALGEELRSGFAFNNATLLSALNEALKAFDAIAIPDTIKKRLYIYEKNTPDTFTENGEIVSSYRQPTGLSIEYGKYLKDIQQNISTEDIVTVIRGVGRDNLTAASATPTGFNEWEDYTYYLDGVFISNWETILENPNTGLAPILNGKSRWMSDKLATKLLLWQFARSSIETILYDTMPIAEQNRLGVYTNKGLVIAQDEIVEQIVNNERKIVPLRIELSKNDTLLTTLDIAENVEHLISWQGSFEGANYNGIDGYTNYINAKRTKVLNEIKQIENRLNLLQSDFDYINELLQQIYISLQKDQFAALFNNNDLSAFNFDENDFKELNGFRREGLYDNKFIAKASDLFLAMKEEIDSLKQPRVEVSANIIGILQTTEAKAEWNNLVLGGLANIIVDRLNVDRQIQIKTLTISPDINNTTITFSTEKNYIGIGQKYLGRFFSNAAYNLKNNLGYNEGFWNRGSADGEDAADKLARGFLIGEDNPLTTQTIIVDDEGITTDGHTVNPLDDTVASATSDIGRMLLFGFVKINAGRIDVYNRNTQGQIINSVVISPTGVIHKAGGTETSMTSTGFKISHNSNSIFSVDQVGNAFFNGNVTVGYNDITGTKPPVDADNTGFAFTQGVVTAGRLEVPSAGVTGDGTANSSVRLYAGSTFANRASAPFRVTQDGALVATNASITGSISASSGFIGNWQINSLGLLRNPNVFLSSLGFIDFSGTGYNTSGFLTNFNLRIDGRSTGSQKIIDTRSGKFSVTADGILSATDGNFSGSINATSGTIGSNTTVGNRWQIGSTSIFNGKTGLDSTTAGAYIGIDGIALGTQGVNPQFSVTAAGALTSTSGNIGGFTIGQTSLIAGNNTTRVGMSPGTNNIFFWAGNNTPTSAPFRVTNTGALIASNATITDGELGPFTVKTAGLPNYLSKLIYTSRMSIRNYTTGASDLWITGNQPFNQGTQENVYLSGLAVGQGYIGMTTNLAEFGIKRVSGNNDAAIDKVTVSAHSSGIIIRNRDYIPATVGGVTISHTAKVPAAHYNSSTQVLTIFLPS